MKTRAWFWSCAWMILCTSWAIAGDPDFTGNWKGTLDTGPAKLRLLFKIQDAGGKLVAQMDSLDQGVKGIPVDSVTAKGDTIRLDLLMVQGVYEGRLEKAGGRITGKWSQGGREMPLVLERAQGTVFAPEPEKLSATELAASKAAATKLAGVWTGSLHASTASIRLRLNFTNAPNGAAIGTMDSLDQGALDIPLSGIMLSNATLRFEVKGFAASYEGAFEEEGKLLKGQWRQAGQTTPLELKKAPTR